MRLPPPGGDDWRVIETTLTGDYADADPIRILSDPGQTLILDARGLTGRARAARRPNGR